jgi:hypothetical protein
MLSLTGCRDLEVEFIVEGAVGVDVDVDVEVAGEIKQSII